MLLVIGLLASPIGCFASCPRHQHECGSQTSSASICPYDILAAAKTVKAALPAIPAVSIETAAAPPLVILPAYLPVQVLDRADLHPADCVLRV